MVLNSWSLISAFQYGTSPSQLCPLQLLSRNVCQTLLVLLRPLLCCPLESWGSGWKKWGAGEALGRARLDRGVFVLSVGVAWAAASLGSRACGRDNTMIPACQHEPADGRGKLEGRALTGHSATGLGLPDRPTICALVPEEVCSFQKEDKFPAAAALSPQLTHHHLHGQLAVLKAQVLSTHGGGTPRV